AGASAGGAVKGYVEELGKDSNTETFVAVTAEIGEWRDHQRWSLGIGRPRRGQGGLRHQLAGGPICKGEADDDCERCRGEPMHAFP
ncbi:hypothetical protein EN788_48190, partial [Mesorhizobium sp. M2D.F.Ca.ET.145.01.1.1]